MARQVRLTGDKCTMGGQVKYFREISQCTSEGAQNELLIKTPSQSRTSAIYKFSTDYVLREQYRDPGIEVRIGKLLEDLDALAGTIAFKVYLPFELSFSACVQLVYWIARAKLIS
jgi:CRP-like cAMP-binding protein